MLPPNSHFHTKMSAVKMSKIGAICLRTFVLNGNLDLSPGALSICVEKPAVRISCQMEQYAWKKQFFRCVIKWNGSLHWKFWEINRVYHQGAWYVSVMTQMVQ